jgi:hypothetical protein
MNFLDFLKDYPGIGGTAIAIVFGLWAGLFEI